MNEHSSSLTCQAISCFVWTNLQSRQYFLTLHDRNNLVETFLQEGHRQHREDQLVENSSSALLIAYCHLAAIDLHTPASILCKQTTIMQEALLQP